jgi:hypothetical protein
MRHQLGLRFDRLREPLHEGIGNATVKLLALAPHHSGVGRILNQRMPENVGRVVRRGPRSARKRQVCASAVWSEGPETGATAASRRYGNSRPMAAPICAISLTGPSLSRRAVNEPSSVVGMASDGTTPTVTRPHQCRESGTRAWRDPNQSRRLACGGLPRVIRLTTITLRHFDAGERAPSTTPIRRHQRNMYSPSKGLGTPESDDPGTDYVTPNHIIAPGPGWPLPL